MNTLVQKPVACAIAAALFLATGTMASAQSSNFYLDLSEGGWVDEVAGLVWGYDYAVISTYCPDDFGFCLSEPLQYTSHPDAEYLAANYREFLATHGFIDDANVAAYWESQGLAWRLPTAEEAANAYQKGLFAGDVYSLYIPTALTTFPRFVGRAAAKDSTGIMCSTTRPAPSG